VKQLLDMGMKTARAILERNRAVPERGAQELPAHETLDAAALCRPGAKLTKETKTPPAIAG